MTGPMSKKRHSGVGGLSPRGHKGSKTPRRQNAQEIKYFVKEMSYHPENRDFPKMTPLDPD